MVVVFSFSDSTLQDWPDVSVFSLVVLGLVDVWVLEAVMCKAVSGVEGGVGVCRVVGDVVGELTGTSSNGSCSVTTSSTTGTPAKVIGPPNELKTLL